MKGFALVSVVVALLFGLLATPLAFAQIQSGGVDLDGAWHPGEGLKHGDYFSYRMCHILYNECSEFDMYMWIKGDKQVQNETKWLVEVVVYDGKKVIVGEMEIGKLAPEPSGGSEDLSDYIDAYKSSIVWLSAFATSDTNSQKGPKEFRAISWGKIANIGGEQILPMAIETVTVPAGTWKTVQVGWKTGGVTSKVWIADGFPFPIQAKTYTHVNTGIPPTEYEFTLLEYKDNVTESPFVGIETILPTIPDYCITDFDKEVTIKKPTHRADYQLHVLYGPQDPVQGCPMQWLIKFISKFNDAEFLNQVHFDLLVTDDDLNPKRSIAQDRDELFLYSQSGFYILDMAVKEDPGTANYVVWIYGTSPEHVVPSSRTDYLQIPVTIYAAPESAQTAIPSWIKTTAGYWVDDKVDDDTFLNGIKYLIEEGILNTSS